MQAITLLSLGEVLPLPHTQDDIVRTEVIYKMFHMLNCGFWNQVSYDHRSYVLYVVIKCVEKDR